MMAKLKRIFIAWLPVIALLAWNGVCWAVEIAPDSNGVFADATANIKADGSTYTTSIHRMLALIRWVSLAAGCGCFFVAGVRFIRPNQRQDGEDERILIKIAIGLFIIAVGVHIVNYFYGAFGVAKS